MLRMTIKVLRVLNSEAHPAQICGALVLGMIIGLTPLWRFHNLLILVLAFGLRINLSTFFLSWGLFSGIGYLFDPYFDQLGGYLLTQPGLTSFWTGLYQSELWRLTRFNHTITLGSLIVSLLLIAPLYWFSHRIVVAYRQHIMQWVMRTRLMRLLMASRLYKAYQTLSDLGGVR